MQTANDYNDDQWHHVALVRSGGALELFVDGDGKARAPARFSSGAITTNLRALGAELRWLQLGHKGLAGVSTFLDGSVDDLCLFDRALTVDEIGRLVEER